MSDGEPLRVLIVAPMPASPAGPGALPVVLNAGIAGLMRRHHVTLLTVAGEEDEVEAARRLSAAGVEVRAVRRPRPAGRPLLRRRLRMAATWLRGRYPWRTIWFAEPGLQDALDAVLADTRFDVISVEDNAMGVLRYPGHVPSVLTEHEVRLPRPIAWGDIRGRRLAGWAFREADWHRWRRYETTVWQRFDRIQVFTVGDAQRVSNLAPQLAGRVRVTPFGIDLAEPAVRAHEEPGAILFVGNFTHAPNVDAALWISREIMPHLRRLAPGVRLRLVGGNPPAEVQQLAGEDVEVTGLVPDVASVFARSALLLGPVRIGGGMRMKVLEAMARGKPVVTTARGVAGLDAVGVEPPAVVAEGPEELARGAARLLADASARAELGRRARDFAAEHFSAEAYAARLEATFAELVAAREQSARGG